VLVGCAARPLRVGTTGDYPPFSVRRDGRWDGLDVEIARRFAQETGRRLELVPFRWPDLVGDLRAGRFDLAMGGVTMEPERAIAGTFTRPIVCAGAVVIGTPAVDAIHRPGVRIGVNAGGHLERLALRLFPQAILVPTTDNLGLAELVNAGTADAVLTDEVEAPRIAAAIPAAVRRGPFTRDAKAYLGTDAALVGALDTWLRAREADGVLATLRARWLGTAAPRTALDSDVDALLAFIDLRLAFMPAVAAAKQRTGTALEDRAQEARVLAAVQDAALRTGLAPASIASLFWSLIRTSRAIQRRFLEHPWRVAAMDLAAEARPAIARVSDEIVVRAAAVARDRAKLDASDIADRLDATLASPRERAHIARAITALRPARHAGRSDHAMRATADEATRSSTSESPKATTAAPTRTTQNVARGPSAGPATSAP
jgi:cyclohexadienyl dehydratase